MDSVFRVLAQLVYVGRFKGSNTWDRANMQELGRV